MGTSSCTVPGAPAELSGRLVRLVALAPEHFEALLAAANQDPAEAFPFTWVPRERAGLRRWLDEALALAAAGQAVPFVTVSAASGQVVGSTRFGNLERWTWPDPTERRSSGLDAVEIGWTWLSRGAQRSGANTEAKLLMLRHAFEAWQVRRVTLKTDARNARSRAAIARLGASLDGMLRSHLPASDGGPRDSAVFSVVEAEWPAVRARLEGLLAR
jgi:RimJ/RimL family protein N-acetyltransferase